MMAEQVNQTRERSELPGLLLPGLVPPLLGILAYAILRESYTWFYGRYGVVPEDVGISQIRVEASSGLPHPVLFGFSVLMLLVILASAWVLPRDRDFAGKRLQLRQGVRPSQLSMPAIQADPVQVIWTGSNAEPGGLVNTRLVYLGHADGMMVLYDPPRWGTCDIDACRGVVWRVNESDAVVRVEVNPPDAHAPSISDLQRSGNN
jgi:hypothetical protein